MIEGIIGFEWIPEEEVIAGADISHYVKKIVQLERRLGDEGRKQSRNQLLEERNEALGITGMEPKIYRQRGPRASTCRAGETKGPTGTHRNGREVREKGRLFNGLEKVPSSGLLPYLRFKPGPNVLAPGE